MDGKPAMVCRNATGGVTVRAPPLLPLLHLFCVGKHAALPLLVHRACLELESLTLPQACVSLHCSFPRPSGPQPFKTRTGLLSNSVWPLSEFGNCPARECAIVGTTLPCK